MSRPQLIVIFIAVLTEPLGEKLYNEIVPTPEMVLDAPLIVTVPALAEKLPLTARFPVTRNELVLVTDPLIVKFAKLIPVPVMVFAVPLIVSIPLLLLWVNCPGPLVKMLPLIEIAEVVAVIPDAFKDRLLIE